MNDKVLYTDGRDVVVTDSTLQIKKHSYRISGIMRHRLLVIPAERLPGIIMILIGIVLVVMGLLAAVPAYWIDPMNINGYIVDGNMLFIWIGSALTVIGILAAALVKPKYAVRISTAEGDKDAIVSYKREYIAQIVDALNRAYNSFHLNAGEYDFRNRLTQVS